MENNYYISRTGNRAITGPEFFFIQPREFLTFNFLIMATENKQIMHEAREALKGKWGMAIGAFVIYIILTGSFQLLPRSVTFVSILVVAPMVLGLAVFSLRIARHQEANTGQIFEGFNRFGTALGAYFLMVLFALLWALLLIVPGIIAAISYAQTFYIIADDDRIGPMEAIDKSKAMMDGYKMKYFRMGLRFFGLALLCVLTLGIGFFWLMPFMQVTMARFYDDIKDRGAVEPQPEIMVE